MANSKSNSPRIPSIERHTFAKNQKANTKPVKVGLSRPASPVKGKS
jgi:hypothetical protein